MAKKPKRDKASAAQKPRHSLGEAIHERLVAAEVAAEEAAGYGWATEVIEAAEAAVDPAHELGKKEPAKQEDEETAGA